MSFFVTSAGSGKGADLGGLAGADAHCHKLAAASWRRRCGRQDLARLPQRRAHFRAGQQPRGAGDQRA
jgi:hypothetical protein